MEPDEQPTRSSSAGPDPSAPKVHRARPSLTLIAAVLTEVVVIAAACNQGVVTALRKRLDNGSRTYADYSRGGIDAITTYAWRFSPADNESTHVWAAQFAAIGTLLVLTAIGVLFVARGSVTFARVFVAVWALVAAIAPVSIMVRQLVVVPSAPGPLQSRVGQSVYGYTDFGPVIVAGVALGLVVGLIAGFVAVLARRKIRIAVVSDDQLPRDEDGEYLDTTFGPGTRGQAPPYEPPPWGTEQTTPYQPAPWGAEQASAQQRPWEEQAPSQQTEQFPRPEQLQPEHFEQPETGPPPPTGAPSEPSPPAWGEPEQHTEQFPRPEQFSSEPGQGPESPPQAPEPPPQAPEPPAQAPEPPPQAPEHEDQLPSPPAAPQNHGGQPSASTDDTTQIPPITDDPGRHST